VNNSSPAAAKNEPIVRHCLE